MPQSESVLPLAYLAEDNIGRAKCNVHAAIAKSTIMAPIRHPRSQQSIQLDSHVPSHKIIMQP